MPSFAEHKKLHERFGLGKLDFVDKVMDATQPLLGPAHRLDPIHSPIGGILLALVSRDHRVLVAHLLHNLSDLISNPNYISDVTNKIKKHWITTPKPSRR